MNPTKLLLGLLTPVIAAGSAWLVGAAAKYGVHLDPSGVNALATAGAAAGAAAMVKLIHDVEHRPAPAVDPGQLQAAISDAQRTLQSQLNEFIAAQPAPVVAQPAPDPASAPPAA